MANILSILIIVIVVAVIVYFIYKKKTEGLMVTGYEKGDRGKTVINEDAYLKEKYINKNLFNPISEDTKMNNGIKENLEDKTALMTGANTNTNRNTPLKPSDLLPSPCMGKNKDWTNTFSECENLIGGHNFVHTEDEHFTNEVLDTRCTKYMSHDLRKTPSIQYDEVSIWNKPSVCKNPYDYIRPGLDAD
jgi:hypothetical protein